MRVMIQSGENWIERGKGRQVWVADDFARDRVLLDAFVKYNYNPLDDSDPVPYPTWLGRRPSR